MHIIIEIPTKINTNNNKVHITDNLPEALLLQGEGNIVVPVSGDQNFPFSFPYILEDFDFDDEYLYRIWHRLRGFPYYFAGSGDLALREILPGDVDFLKKLFSFTDNLSCSDFVKDTNEINYTFLEAYIKNIYGIFDYGFFVLCLREIPIGLFGIGALDSYDLPRNDFSVSNLVFPKNQENPTHSLGYCLLPQYRGMGLGFSGVQLLVDYSKSIGISGLVARVHKNNIPSLRILQKLGFN